jgi:hypothetical protein
MATITVKSFDELRREWISHGYGDREFEWACDMYPLNDPNSYTCVTGYWKPFFCKEYQHNEGFRNQFKIKPSDLA